MCKAWRHKTRDSGWNEASQSGEDTASWEPTGTNASPPDALMTAMLLPSNHSGCKAGIGTPIWQFSARLTNKRQHRSSRRGPRFSQDGVCNASLSCCYAPSCERVRGSNIVAVARTGTRRHTARADMQVFSGNNATCVTLRETDAPAKVTERVGV